MANIQIDSSKNLDDTKSQVIGKLVDCSYCILEYLVPKDKRTLKRGQKFIFGQVPKAHRKRIEDICKDCDRECDLKKIAMNCFDERYLTQGGCVEIFKLDRGKKIRKRTYMG